jgi:haloalkane dehalogenase
VDSIASRRVEAGGVDVHYLEQGSGRPLLLLHGNPDSAHVWAPVIERLPPQIRCIAPDLPGFGESRIAGGRFGCTLPELGAWVDAFVRALGLPLPIDLAVHDFGGPFGLAWAAAAPERVRRLAVVDSIFHADYRWHFWANVWRTPLLGELAMAALSVPRLGAWLFDANLRAGGPALTAARRAEAFRRYHPRARRMALQLYRATHPDVFRAFEAPFRALQARTPTLVLWGDRDPYIDSRFARRFGADEVHHFPDCGHWLPLEDPNAVAMALERHFLA